MAASSTMSGQQSGMVALQRFDLEDHRMAGAKTPGYGMATLDGGDTGDVMSGGGTADQATVATSPPSLRGVDDDVDQPILDQPNRVPRSLANLVDAVGRDACLL